MHALKRIAATIAAALAAMPKLVWTVVVEGGRSVLRLVRKPTPLPQSQFDGGLPDFELPVNVEDLTQWELMRAFLIARRRGIKPPPIDKLIGHEQRWLHALTREEADIVMMAGPTKVYEHLEYSNTYRIPGVRLAAGKADHTKAGGVNLAGSQKKGTTKAAATAAKPVAEPTISPEVQAALDELAASFAPSGPRIR